MSPLARVVLLPLVLGTTLCFWAGRVETPARRRLSAAIAAAVALASLGLLLQHAPAVLAGEVLLTKAEWAPAIGLNANFRLDALALMFAGLITGIGVLVVLYAHYYLHHDDPAGKFFATLMLFISGAGTTCRAAASSPAW